MLLTRLPALFSAFAFAFAFALVLGLTSSACRSDDPSPRASPGSGSGSASSTGTGSTVGSASSAGSASSESLSKARTAVGELKHRLVGALTEALKQGPTTAIAVCSGHAPAIAEALAVDGVTVGRATRKPRNPANAAAGWHAEALARFEAMLAAGQPLAGATWIARLPDGATAYAEPLLIQPLCATCHGAALADDVRGALAAKYPADQATGYAIGALRGVAWAEVRTPQ